MHVIALKKLVQFWEQHADASEPLEAWYAEAKHAHWTCPDDIRQRYRHADFLVDNRIVFSIGGHKYRLIVRINYGSGTVFICFVGTHAEYSRVDAEKVR